MKRIVLYIALAALAASAWAADFSASGFATVGERVEDGTTYAVLKDPAGREVLFRAAVEPTAARLGALRSLMADLPAWKGLDIALVTAVNEAERLQIVVVPRKLQYGASDLAPNLPGGIAFYFSTSVEYDFRVVSGLYVVRIRGVLTGSAEVLDAIAGAVKDPVNFLATRDPQYAVRKITEIAIKLDEFALVHTDLYDREADLALRADGADARAEALEVRANEAEFRSDQIEKAFDARSASIENRASSLEGRASGLEAKSSNLEGRANAVEGRAGALEKRSGALENRADTSEGRSSVLEGRATKLENRTATTEGRSDSLENRATILENRAT
ncbi:MAG: hypothetical protein Q8M76_19335, partial [Spirochaetaceae bacterium]|nr:hypothetical protein [Spirochaetaceae bacterium]